MPDVFAAFDAHVRAREREYLDELSTLIRLPTVSAQRSAMEETARALLDRATRAGFAASAERVPGGPPTIIGEQGAGQRTLLVYDHYDVQPPDPLDEWRTPPFEPTIRDGFLFGRGTSDNKGIFMARLQAIESYKATVGPLPLRVRILFEGEEEIGSEHLNEFARTYADRLKADGCIWEAGYKDAAGRPTVSLGLKGICYVTLTVRGTKLDAHSSVGGIVPNAAWRLTWALASLKNERGEITVDGLMEHVRRPSAADLALLDRMPWNEDDFKKIYGIGAFYGWLHCTTLRRPDCLQPDCT